MTINDLIKQLTEEQKDYFVLIVAPIIDIDDRREEPLIEVNIDDNYKRIYLEGDFR